MPQKHSTKTPNQIPAHLVISPESIGNLAARAIKDPIMFELTQLVLSLNKEEKEQILALAKDFCAKKSEA